MCQKCVITSILDLNYRDEFYALLEGLALLGAESGHGHAW